MYGTLRAARVFLAVIGFTAAVGAQAQTRTLRVAIGSFTSERQCTTYAVTSGSERFSGGAATAASVGPWSGVAASEASLSYQRRWHTELLRDCVNNFVAVRRSLEAAIASSGHVVVVPIGTRGAYTLTGRVSEAGLMSSSLQAGGATVDSTDVALNVQFSLRDGRGQNIAGSLITKRLNIGSNTSNGLVDYQSSTEGRSIYTQLQREVALAVGRAVVFRLEPLRVVEVAPQRVRLNYGAPLLNAGATVFLMGAGGEPIKGLVANAFNGAAWVETRGNGDVGQVAVGSVASFVEQDDPNANTPVFERVELP